MGGGRGINNKNKHKNDIRLDQQIRAIDFPQLREVMLHRRFPFIEATCE